MRSTKCETDTSLKIQHGGAEKNADDYQLFLNPASVFRNFLLLHPSQSPFSFQD